MAHGFQSNAFQPSAFQSQDNPFALTCGVFHLIGVAATLTATGGGADGSHQRFVERKKKKKRKKKVAPRAAIKPPKELPPQQLPEPEPKVSAHELPPVAAKPTIGLPPRDLPRSRLPKKAGLPPRQRPLPGTALPPNDLPRSPVPASEPPPDPAAMLIEQIAAEAGEVADIRTIMNEVVPIFDMLAQHNALDLADEVIPLVA